MSTPEIGGRIDRRQLMEGLARELRSYQSALDGFDETIAELLGINRTDLRCLDLLSLRQPMTAGALAKASGLTTGAITFVLDRMEKAGFIERRRDPEDRRRVFVELVSTAQEIATQLHQPLVKEWRERARGFGPEEIETIRSFLRIGYELYEKHTRLLRATARHDLLEDLAPRQESD